MSLGYQRPAQIAKTVTQPAFDRIARRIGLTLREVYGAPEAEPLPMEHVELLLKLRHKERDRLRARGE